MFLEVLVNQNTSFSGVDRPLPLDRTLSPVLAVVELGLHESLVWALVQVVGAGDHGDVAGAL